MPIIFEVYRVHSDGERELVHTAQSAGEAREFRDADLSETLVVARDAEQPISEKVFEIESSALADVEGD